MKRLFKMLWPRSGFSWFLLALFVFMFSVAILPNLLNPKGLLLLLAVLSCFLAVGLSVPDKWFSSWERIPPFIRKIVVAAIFYFVMVTIANFGELHHFPLWADFLLVRGETPWTSTYYVAILGAFWSCTTQREVYEPTPIPQDTEVPEEGQGQVITFEAVKVRWQELHSEEHDEST